MRALKCSDDELFPVKPPSLLLVLAVSLITLTASPSYADPGEPDRRFKRVDRARLGTYSTGRRSTTPTGWSRHRRTDRAANCEAAKGDRKAAVRRVRATQEGVLPRLRAAGATPIGQVTTVLNATRVRVKVGDLDALAAVPG